MMNRILIAVALAGTLSVAAAAQQNGAAPSQSPSTSSSSSAQIQTGISSAPDQAPPAASSPEQMPTATGKEPLAGPRKEGFWGHLNPFARKKYIQRQLDPVRGRVNELDELTAANSKAIRDLDSRATEGIRQATLMASTADQHAVDAGNRAQLAHTTATEANSRLTTVSKTVENIDQYQTASEAEIRFRPGQVVLSKKAKDALDELAGPAKTQKGYIIQVRGFAPGKGHEAIASSQQMASSVVRYLVEEHEIPVYRIYAVGMGNAPVKTEDGKMTRTRGGRVEVALLRNSVADMDAAPVSAPASTGTPTSSAPAASTTTAAATESK
jgi:outer membrane protein OmpA-like peptidoglycan-associated protein